MAPPRFVIIRHPDGVPPGTYFPTEYENEWYDREEHGLNARVLVIPPATLCFPTGKKLRRKSDGAIADVYEPVPASLYDPMKQPAPEEVSDATGSATVDQPPL